MNVKKTDFQVPIENSSSADIVLGLHRFCVNETDPSIFILHGVIENGGVFYSRSGKGLAPFLAKNGFDVFVGDLRGRGSSRPKISESNNFGQYEQITEDIPAFLSYIAKIKAETKMHWIAHSWGGVLLMAYLARFPKQHQNLSSIVTLATKRRITVKNFEKFLGVDLAWGLIGGLSCKVLGYFPAKTLGFGSDDETSATRSDCSTWVKSLEWIDPSDKFDYSQAFKSVKVPPVLALAGLGDRYLGHPDDCKSFLKEIDSKHTDFRVIGKQVGNFHDYGHVDILTHPDAPRDHFPQILDWVKSF